MSWIDLLTPKPKPGEFFLKGCEVWQAGSPRKYNYARGTSHLTGPFEEKLVKQCSSVEEAEKELRKLQFS